MSSLQTQIKKRLEDKNLSARALEIKAGVGTGAVQRILSGTSKSLSTKTLTAISSILECSINELLGEDQGFSSSTVNLKKSYPWNAKLYIQSTQIVEDYIQHHSLNLSSEKIITAILDVYEFSFQSDPPEIDPKFCSWILEKIR